MKLGAKIFGILAGVLILYLLWGLLLPGTWEAEAEASIPHPPGVVFPYLNQVHRWIQWNAMPESGSEIVGPEEGPGAALHWDDPQYGKGRFKILANRPEVGVEYEVLIEGGALKILGALELTPQDEGSRLVWLERGDFGRNPLMGYAARGMGGSQSDAMKANLERLLLLLNDEVGGGTAPRP